jgi:hypothetical protein
MRRQDISNATEIVLTPANVAASPESLAFLRRALGPSSRCEAAVAAGA